MKSILDLNNTDARDFFLKQDSYSNINLPHYFSFENLIKEIDKKLEGKSLSDFREVNPRQFDNVNYKLLSNKDGKFAWRPFELINPAIYVSLVHRITDSNNWETITTRFRNFQTNDNIECHSLPVISENDKISNKTYQILNWWQMIEQKSMNLALEFNHVLHTDITDCYGDIYTHSIPWAIHTKETAKTERRNKNLIGNIIDNHIQDMRYGQTNGIPQGSSLMNFIAEIVLGYVDLLLSEKLDHLNISEYRILRYRDDYRIFTQNSFTAEQIAKELSEILSNLGLKLNADKTIPSDDIIKSSIKPDKRYWISNKVVTGNKQKWLIQLYLLSEKFPNSGTIDTQMRDFLRVLKKSKKEDKNIETLISLVTEIAIRNPRVVPTCIAILSVFLGKIKDVKTKNTLAEKIRNKFKNVPNSSFIMVWFQRLYLKINKAEEYSETICKKVLDKNTKIWNNEWLNPSLKKLFDETSIILESKVKKTKKKFSNKEILELLSKSINY